MLSPRVGTIDDLFAPPSDAPADAQPERMQDEPPSGSQLGITAKEAWNALPAPAPESPIEPAAGLAPGQIGGPLGDWLKEVTSSPGSPGALIGQALEPYNASWRTALGVIGAGATGNLPTLGEAADQVLARRGVAAPSPFDKASAIGELADSAFSQTEGLGRFIADMANPWYVAAGGPVTKGAVGVGEALRGAGLAPEVAGFVESTIANWGLPYADKALNAVFVNSLTRAAARRAGHVVGDLTDLIGQAIEPPKVAFASSGEREAQVQAAAAARQAAESPEVARIREAIATIEATAPTTPAEVTKQRSIKAILEARLEAARTGTPARPGSTFTPAQQTAERAAARERLAAEKPNVPPVDSRVSDSGIMPTETARAPRFSVRDGAVYDAKLGKVDDILTARAAQGSATAPSAGKLTRWARWADRLDANGQWNEHNVTPTAPPGTPPAKPPAPPTQHPPLPRGTPEEGPSPVITSVVDRPDGTFSLRTVDLDGGIRIVGERFASRDSALRTAEQMNAERNAVTMIDNALQGLRDTIDLPATPALPSSIRNPGQSQGRDTIAAREAAIKAEAARQKKVVKDAEVNGRQIDENADRQLARLYRERADALRQGLFGDAGVVPQHLELPSASGQPLTRTTEQLSAERTRLEGEARRLDQMAADAEKRAARERAARLTEELRRMGVPEPKSRDLTDDEKQIIADRFRLAHESADRPKNPREAAIAILEELGKHPGSVIPGAFSAVARTVQTGLDVGVIGRQLLGVLGKNPNQIPAAARAALGSYRDPDVTRSLAMDAYTRALKNGGTALHFRGTGEFTGEQISQNVLDLVESVPGVGEAFRRSAAAFDNPINLVISNIFNSKVEQAAAKGVPMDQALKDKLAWTLNHDTGYAYDPQSLGKVGGALHVLGSALYSRQWQASRVAVAADFAKALPRIVSGRADVADKEAFWSGLISMSANAIVIASTVKSLNLDGEVLDWKSPKFAQLPIGAPGPKAAAMTALLAPLGISVYTDDRSQQVYADFTRGFGSDFRTLAQIAPFGGPNGKVSGVAKTRSGQEFDPYNTKFGQRNVSDILVDWFTGKGQPVTSVVAAAINPFSSAPADDRIRDAIGGSLFVMWTADLLKSGGGFAGLGIDKAVENITRGTWFGKPAAAPVRAGATASPGTGTYQYR